MVDDRTQDGTLGKGNGDGFAHLGRPDDIDVSIELRDWLFALEGREGHYLPGGVNIEANIVASEDKSGHDDTLNWVAESLKFSVKQPALKLCSYQTLEKQFVLIHGNSVTNGFISNLHLNNSLVNLYARHGDMKHARKLFDRMPERDVVSWTAMISGYSGCGYHLSAFLLFKQMRREPVRANDFTYGSVLKSCKGLGCLKEGMQVHGCVEKGRFVENLVVRSALLCLYAKCGKMEDARLLFESMKERDLVSWNIIIHGYTASAADTSFGLFQLMLAEGKKPDCYTFGSLLRASIQVNCLEMVSELHGFAIKLGFKRSDVALVRSLIVAYAKCGSLGNALKLYDRTMKGDLISCTAIITGLAQQNNFTSDAFDIFKEMILMKTQMDEVVVSSMLKICTTIASISIGRQIHCFALKSSQIRFDVALRNSLIDMYAKSGEIEDAVLAFEEMEEKDVRSWTSLISGYGRHGDIEKAISLYNRMEQEGIKPNDVTFLALLSACSHTGETEIGWKILNTMINKYGIKVREEHLSCMVDMLARGGNLEDAYELIRSENSITSLSSSTCGAFLDACRRHGDVQLSQVAAAQLLSMEPKKPVNYINLASVYASNEDWDNALKTRKLMKETGSCNKSPGYSIVY
uniref:Pentacotripeptide-repeat region of PRORP domain-containing protein n=1 Tax=Brassica campestris TaxID=3711 RepID=M4F3V2_BRACM